MFSLPFWELKKQAHPQEKVFRILYQLAVLEGLLCPCCGHRLIRYGWRRRLAMDGCGKRFVFLIPRLRCRGCGKTHHVLPSFLIPCKRYFLAVILAFARKESRKPLYPLEESSRFKLARYARWLLLQIQDAFGSYFRLPRDQLSEFSLEEMAMKLVPLGFFTATRTAMLSL